MREQEVETWHCGKCPYSVLIPWEELSAADYTDALMRVREHRFAHLVSALETATDKDLLDLCDDEPERSEPVTGEDAVHVLAGVTELLKADLPRARKDTEQWA